MLLMMTGGFAVHLRLNS